MSSDLKWWPIRQYEATGWLSAWVSILRLRATASAPALTLLGYGGDLGRELKNAPAGVLLACVLSFSTVAFAQIFNDIQDRHADALYKPSRPIPAGHIDVSSAAIAAVISILLSLTSAILLGDQAITISLFGLLLGFA